MYWKKYNKTAPVSYTTLKKLYLNGENVIMQQDFEDHFDSFSFPKELITGILVETALLTETGPLIKHFL